MLIVDQATVKAVELMAPKSSKRDAQALHGQLLSGQIFSGFSLEARETIWSGLRTISGLILSLYTIFEDLKYLEACAGSMRHLVMPSPKHTMRSALNSIFFWNEPTRRPGCSLLIFHTVGEEVEELALYVSAVMVVHYA